MIPRNFIQELLNRLDIVDVVEHYVPLKKSGANFVACCPFHNEKSPSFTVSQSKQFYHCFGCGAHGTAIGFVMEHTGLGFVDAVGELAKSIGLTVPREATAPASSTLTQDLHDLMNAASRYYRDQLKQSPRAIEYLRHRGLSGETAARFGIGFAPDSWRNLEEIFPNYQDVRLQEIGLVIASDDNKRYDRFRDRIMFPIVNQRGLIIGFGGRVLDKGEPKYLNSPETPLFEKGRELYGLFHSQKAARTNGKVLVVEGYMDVVALAQHGIDYAVATLGTATTSHHLQKLLRLTDRVIFCFDGDAAGQRAAWRALENALPLLTDGKRIDFLFLPEIHDPDSYVREYGKDAFEKLYDQALPLSTYLLRELTSRIDLHTQEGRAALLERAKPLLSMIPAPTASLLLRKELAALSGITQQELEGLYALKPVGVQNRRSPPRIRTGDVSSVQALLRCLLAKPELAREVQVELQFTGADALVTNALLDYLREQDFSVSTAAIIQHFQGTQFEPILTEIEAGLLFWGDQFDVESEFQVRLAKLTEEQDKILRQGQLKDLLAKIQNMGGGVKGLNEQEKALYLQLTSQRKPS